MLVLMSIGSHRISAEYKGQVSIKVYRGPPEGHKDHRGKYGFGFAPWGYYAKLPEEDSTSYKKSSYKE